MPRMPLFLLGAFALALAIGVEVGSLWLVGHSGAADGIPQGPPPGIGIRYLALVDAVVAYSLVLIAVDLVPVLRPIAARLQGIVTLLLALGALLATIALLFAAITLTMLMVSLLLAPPFGTLAYFAIWSTFKMDDARMLLGLAMTLKIGGSALLVLAMPSFLKNKGFMLLMGCSLGVTFVLGFLHALPPGFLVSITDAVGAIVAAVVALIWMVILLVGAMLAIVRAVRSVAPV